MLKVLRTMIFVLVGALMASSAMAFQVTNRSAEMAANSLCDRAGTIQMNFEKSDWDQIFNYLYTGTAKIAEIRIALNGTDLPPNPQLPVLCKDIKGTDIAAWNDVGPPSIQNTVKLTQAGEIFGPFSAYVYAEANKTVIHVYITRLAVASDAIDWTNPDAVPWFKIGLTDTELGYTEGGHGTAICANVKDFSGISKLTISNESAPTGLTFSGDNEIGHFLVQSVEVRNCTISKQRDEEALISCHSTSSVRLCPVEEQGECPHFTKCLVIQGDLPTEDMYLDVRTNGAKTGDATQTGIFLMNVALYDYSGAPITYSPSDIVYYGPGDTVIASPTSCAFEVVRIQIRIPGATLAAAGGGVLACVSGDVDPARAVAGTNIRLFLEGNTIPCGHIFEGVINAASLVACETGATTCIYFPYVLVNFPGWNTGIAITNLQATPDFTTAKATFTLTDSAGKSFTYEKTDFTSTVFAFGLNSILANFSGTPAAGAGWLKVETNFAADGFNYVIENSTGLGGTTLPRLWCNGDLKLVGAN